MRLDVVGHFGSRLSYATISDQLVQELIDRDALGNVVNLDDQFIDLSLKARPQRERGERVILLSDPRDHLVDALVATYGRDNVSIFVCPNTNTLSYDHAVACGRVGRIYTPSRWCEETIARSTSEETIARATSGEHALGSIITMPLGVDDVFVTCPFRQAQPIREKRLLHLTSDGFWPSRKGTEELLKAWQIAREEYNVETSTLVIHSLARMHSAIYQEAGDLGLLDSVTLLSAPPRGSSPDDLLLLMQSCTLLVAPSRSEGFGIMPLSALVSGMPVLTTADTGQDYLTDRYLDDHEEPDLRGKTKLGGWWQIPTMHHDILRGEVGQAPTISADQLAISIALGLSFLPDEKSIERNKLVRNEWSWRTRRAAWVDSLLEA